ncbi:MAG: hypothetical protein P4M08_07405 [Oligoflexia bacterium]|nr:hypothetical protein [Oligoflexia bacterium]
MKIRFLVLSLICSAFGFLSACHTQNEEAQAIAPSQRLPAAPSPSPSPSPSSALWTAEFTAHCTPGASLTNCPGGYGFRVQNDGFYLIGPGPAGQRVSGQLGDADLQRMKELLLRQDSHGRGQCEPPKPGGHDSERDEHDSAQGEHGSAQGEHGSAQGENDSELGETVVLRQSGSARSSCNPELLEEVRSLVSRYYPESFPNPCVDANAELEKFYDQALSCSRDADCAYLGGNYLPLDTASAGSDPLIVDDCSFVSPLLVANTFKAVELQRDLILKREWVESGCTEKKPSCEKSRSWTPSSGHPACIDHQCRPAAGANPNFQY